MLEDVVAETLNEEVESFEAVAGGKWSECFKAVTQSGSYAVRTGGEYVTELGYLTLGSYAVPTPTTVALTTWGGKEVSIQKWIEKTSVDMFEIGVLARKLTEKYLKEVTYVPYYGFKTDHSAVKKAANLYKQLPPSKYVTLVHNDIHVENLRGNVFLDWGAARFVDPCWELATTVGWEPEYLEAFSKGYRASEGMIKRARVYSAVMLAENIDWGWTHRLERLERVLSEI